MDFSVSNLDIISSFYGSPKSEFLSQSEFSEKIRLISEL